MVTYIAKIKIKKLDGNNKIIWFLLKNIRSNICNLLYSS